MSNPLGFAARERDPLSSFSYLRARYYDPELARFLSEDPIGLAGGLNPYGTGRNDTTRYAWDPKWDLVTRIVPPEKDSVVMAYDPNTGNRLWQQDARGSASHVSFGYHADGLLATILEPGTANPTRFEYDSQLRNLQSTQTPLGYQTTLSKDGLGRDTLILFPIDSLQHTQQRRQQQKLVYDAMDRVTEERTSAPAMNGAEAQSITVQNGYDAEGNLETHTRSWSPSAGIYPQTTRWQYDGAGRERVRTRDGASDSTGYDPAGNVTRQVTRRGHRITLEYDARNRLKKRRLPAVTYDSLTRGIPEYRPDLPFREDVYNQNVPYPLYPNHPAGGYTIAADSAVFAYDEMGNLEAADNGDAQVRRTWFRTGQIRTETQRIRTLRELAEGGKFSQHVLHAAVQLRPQRAGAGPDPPAAAGTVVPGGAAGQPNALRV